jgi:hypothetical protein
MMIAPGDDIVEIVAVGDGCTGEQQQDLGERNANLPRVAIIVDLGKLFEENGDMRRDNQEEITR